MTWETLHVKDEHGDYTHISEVLFGCWNSDQCFKFGHDGFFFIMRRFSYCLVDPILQGESTRELPEVWTGHGTPFVKLPNSYSYGLNLLDISVNNKRLNFAPDTFKAKSGGDEGFIIDSRLLFFIVDNAYPILEVELTRYFSALKQLQRRQDCPRPTKLCYYAPMGFSLFPSMTFHFEGANLAVAPEHAFASYPKEKVFFLAIAPLARISILGAFQ
ncbi:hypothetical protein ACOSQ2_031084 [Xanthoceras sorbifolium]